MKRFVAAAFVATLVACRAGAVEPNGGYYQGLSILYPYDPVFCDKNGGMGSPCYGMPGSHLFLPRSAPLPPAKTYCVWADRDDPEAYVSVGPGVVSPTGKGWYHWKPRIITLYGADAKVCYLEDRGVAQSINDLPKD